MTARVIVVEKCAVCPYARRIYSITRAVRFVCARTDNAAIPDPQTIPDFCPLPKKGGRGVSQNLS